MKVKLLFDKEPITKMTSDRDSSSRYAIILLITIYIDHEAVLEVPVTAILQDHDLAQDNIIRQNPTREVRLFQISYIIEPSRNQSVEKRSYNRRSRVFY